MTHSPPQIVVAGHICLDIIPTFPSHDEQDAARIEPGKLYLMGPALCATGGVVSNTGLALHQLGIPTTLMGKVAGDLFGNAVLDILRRYHPDLAEGMIVTPGENTSYSIVISPPGVDRAFLHCPGANDTFRADDIRLESLHGARLLHFGYPTLMEQFYSDEGRQLAGLFRRVQAQGLLTSLDMSLPDPQSPAGRIDWLAWLARVLPAVDLYLPSIEETLFMLDRPLYDSLLGSDASSPEAGHLTEIQDPQLLQQLSEQLLELGAAVVVLKLGEQGLYMRTAERGIRQPQIAPGSKGESVAWQQSAWQQRELMAPCFEVEVAGTTGAGDSTIAGLLAALVHGADPAEALVQAVAVGACSVEAADATSGICTVSQVRHRIASGWKRHATLPPGSSWNWDDAVGVWRGPADARNG
jgi:sugar/nucleoside kinase (ribokinase family)